MTPSDLESRFTAHCRDRRYFQPGDRLLLAVSGGMDSTVMLDLFCRTKDRLQVILEVFHLNHGLRGAESDGDEAFVKALCAKAGIPCHADRVDVRAEAESGESLESAARRIRYALLNRCAEDCRLNYICTAHHRDDQAETVLARIIHGTGWTGLCGIRERNGKLVRPLLAFSREDISLYAGSRHLAYRTDSTNSDMTIFRNRVRRRLLPLLASEYDPQTASHLIHLSAIAGETLEWAHTEVKRLWAEACCYADKDKIKLDINYFNHYLLFQRKLLIEKAFAAIFNTDPEALFLRYQDYTAIIHLAASSESGSKFYRGKAVVLKTQSYLVFYHAEGLQTEPFCMVIGSAGEYNLSDNGIRFVLKPYTGNNRPPLGMSRYVEYIDGAKIRGTLVLRNWKPGDRFIPLGMQGMKKLSDFFTDKKIDILNKPLIPLLTDRFGDEEQIVWVCGWRLDERYKIDKNTKTIYQIECDYHET